MLNLLPVGILVNLTLSDNIQIIDGISMSLTNLIRLVLLMAVMSLILGFAAWRRAGRNRQAAVSATAPAALAAGAIGLSGSAVTDPAIIAVLSAAVSMMLEESSQGHFGQSAPPTAAGFTIRKIRRV